ncbi:HAD-IIIC family phosphatase [Streptomyces sp. MST-110588]|uniref:HAD-IIIC family phosphatase n=1 Tax=Streptomyces sp. MST-110588 TaxID=2833628 RepID=UPI001F5CE656|nr:HAD-IIIC family phosphatase [Streptomyces sp. MST-110588]UNO40114.1 HAD-IIIC family phosphatase [Streptomyces sp. MST-110588]
MDDLLARVRRLAAPDAVPDPALPAELTRTPDVALVREAGRRLAGADSRLLVPPGRQPRDLRVAVVSSFTADNLLPLLRVFLLAAGVTPEFHLTAPDQQLMELGGADSGLADFDPELTLCLVHEHVFLPQEWDPTDLPALRDAVRERWEAFAAAVHAFADRGAGVLAVHTVPLPVHHLHTVVAHRSRSGVSRIWYDLNTRMLELAERLGPVEVLDLQTLLTGLAAPLRDERLHLFAGMAWSPDVEHLYAREAAGLARAVTGLAKKCLVLDLDNTLWGGVLGDDGPENIDIGPMYPGNAYAALQRTVLALRRQGVLLAVASKNDAALVSRVFAEHPELVLREKDFVAVRASWDAKDGSIKEIAAELNIGLDAMVFLDDSPFECDLVRGALPQVDVVRADNDPALHVNRLLAGGHFDVLTTTGTDQRRTELYRARARRRQWSAGRETSQDYLAGLGLRVRIRTADAYLLPRVVQLGERTNQFNLVGRAFPEAQTRRMAESDTHQVLAFEVSDRFGQEGVVGAVWLSRHPGHWLIENAVMSCRVFSRGIEFAVLQTVADAARAAGMNRLEAAFRDSGRNGPAERFLAKAGFAQLPHAAPGPQGTARRVLPLDPPPVLAPAWITVDDEG